MQEEIRLTIISKHGEEYYIEWKKIPTKDRTPIGTTVLYDMGWQQRLSGRKYASASGHGFLVGVMTQQIIDLIVFSNNCHKCKLEKQRKVKKKERMREQCDSD